MGLIEVPSGSNPVLNPVQEGWEDKLTEFYTVYLSILEGDIESLSLFAMPQDSATGFYAFIEDLEKNGPGPACYLKGQIVGPLTTGLYLTDQHDRPAYYNPHLRDLLVKTVALQARWQAEILSRFGLPVLIFIDDPAIGSWGNATYITLDRGEIINDIREVSAAINEGGALSGLHTCARADWSLCMDAGICILSYDAYEYFDSLASYSSLLKNFLETGGVLAWGLVPTSEKVERESVASLLARLHNGFEILTTKGIPKELLTSQIMITPSCGTGALSNKLAEKIYRLTAEVSLRFRESRFSRQAASVRLD
jgi:hypothetical protein